ncbi:30S ribosomal protein S8 [Hippea alviniae]|uniref:30S ribosomal protein S8 n=1 Tax=Hippea alviniae TaxID=1279027 RepID=UPI0003B3CA9D|nr:30S ribosomal protein S8 [Hippea alviniae]
MSKKVADCLSKIKNGLKAKHDYVDVHSNNLVENVIKILKEEGYIADYKKLDNVGNRNMVRVFLKYADENKRKPVIMMMKMVSKPSRRVYISADEIKPVMNGLGIGIISTSKGVMTTQQAKKLGIGGEYICEVF